MGVHLLLRYVHNLTALHLSWADAPSSVLTGTSFRLHTFASNMYVDGTVIQFLEAQTSLRTLELGAWGAHLPPSSSSYSAVQYPPAPPMLAPTALPALAEFTGHAEVAAQLAAGGRPIQAVNLISGLPSSAGGSSSSVVTQEWREIMRGLSSSPMGVRSLSVVGIEHFGLEMLAEIGRHLHDLDYLFLRVQRPASASVRLSFSCSLRSNFLTFLLLSGHLPLRALEELPTTSREPRADRHRALRLHIHVLFTVRICLITRHTSLRRTRPTMAQYLPSVIERHGIQCFCGSRAHTGALRMGMGEPALGRSGCWQAMSS